jgi:Activator of Hsp90 ATPase homolog 1-like protein
MTTGAGLPPATSTNGRPPPVRQSTVIRVPLDRAFASFVHTIDVWWPKDVVSVGGERVTAVVLEPRPGGRVFERWDDGTTIEWGAVTAWEPPARFVMSWCNTPVPTEVEFTFSPLGPSLTRVAVEHRGWEALSAAQRREDCAAPGGYSSGAYGSGWRLVLERLAAGAEAAAAGEANGR